MTGVKDPIFGDQKLDRKVTYLKPTGAAAVERVVVEVKDDDYVETAHGIVLRAHNSDNLLGVLIPWERVEYVAVLKRFAEAPGYV